MTTHEHQWEIEKRRPHPRMGWLLDYVCSCGQTMTGWALNLRPVSDHLADMGVSDSRAELRYEREQAGLQRTAQIRQERRAAK